ncbi:MAG: hypothetical protein KDB68_10720 [Planctomycetes bacterium]|nr:hypothetical protein [Planctomycetota bacterium]
MDQSELKQRLIELDIEPRCYELDSGGREGTYGFGEAGGGWIVYYVERGQKNVLARSLTVEDIRAKFLEIVIKGCPDRSGDWDQRPSWWIE